MSKAFPRFEGTGLTEYAKEESKILGRDLWRVRGKFSFWMSPQRFVSIPRGYLVDGASVPRMLWAIIPPWGAYGDATIVHDILCEYLTIVDNGRPVKISREEADNILAEAMEVLEVDSSDQRLINTAVAAYRKVGRVTAPVWHKNKAELEAKWVAANPLEV